MGGGNQSTPDGFFEPTNWADPDEAEYVINDAEGYFAELLYVAEEPPTPKEFILQWTEAFPEIGQPEWPEGAKKELLGRCCAASLRIALADDTYEHYRDIYTEEAREAARLRRRVSKDAVGRWIASGYRDEGAYEAMSAAIEAIHAERRG